MDDTWIENMIRAREAARQRREEETITSDPARMYAFIRTFFDQPAPRRETNLDRQFERLKEENAAFKAFWETYRAYRNDLEYWCKWTQMGAPGFNEAKPARPAGIPAAFEQDMLSFYRLAHA